MSRRFMYYTVPTLFGCVAAGAVGCQQGTAQQDVAQARQQLQEDQETTLQAQERSAQRIETDEVPGEQAMLDRNQYVQAVEMDLTEADERIEQLQTRAGNAQKQEQKQLYQQVEQLQTARDNLREALSELEGAEISNWLQQRQTVEQARESLQKQMQQQTTDQKDSGSQGQQ